MEIDLYLDILAQRLLRYKVKHRYTQRICKDIRNRMLSLLGLWNHAEARNAILFLSLEEAPFYMPKAKPYVAEFVVATIRNSMLEIACSDNCGEFKMTEPISNAQIKEITSEAIFYFNKLDFEALSKQVASDFTDVYDDAACKYPLAWHMLNKIANMNTQTLENFQVLADVKSTYTEESFYKQTIEKTVFDGFTPEIEPPLMERLNAIKQNGGVLYVDCSKMLTRNFEKYLHVLQFILENNGEFCTSNYYISNTLLEKRETFLKASHTVKEMKQKLEKFVDAPPSIKKCMESFV